MVGVTRVPPLAEHRHASTTTHAVYVIHLPPGR